MILILTMLIIVDFTTNLALGKIADMSSRQYAYYSALAVDGSYRNNWYGACAVTERNLTAGSWWKVDLDAVYDIKTVMILNRPHCCGETETLTLYNSIHVLPMAVVPLCSVISSTNEPVFIQEMRMQFSR